jgi:DNA replication protein DnaD
MQNIEKNWKETEKKSVGGVKIRKKVRKKKKQKRNRKKVRKKEKIKKGAWRRPS